MKFFGALLLAVALPLGAMAATPERSPDSAARDSLTSSLLALERAGRFAAAESAAVAFLEREARRPRADSLAMAIAYRSIGLARFRRGSFGDGVGLDAFERSIAIHRRQVGRDDDFIAATHVLAARSYSDAGRYEQSRAHGREAVRIFEFAAKPDTVQLSGALLWLTLAERGLGSPEMARAPLARALALRVAKFGPQHREIVPYLAEYGQTLADLGEFDLAREHFDRAVRIADSGAAERDNLLEESLSRLSSLENAIGNLAESYELALRALESNRSKWGDSSVRVLRGRVRVAYRLEQLGDQNDAIAELRSVLPTLTRQLGPTNAQVLTARLALADLSIALEDTSSTREELRALAQAIGTQRTSGTNRRYCRYLQAKLQRLAGDVGGARAWCESTLAVAQAEGDAKGGSSAGAFAEMFETIAGPADRAYAESVGARANRLPDSTSVRATPEWIALLGARARAEARVGLPERAWSHALEAEQLAHTNLQYQLRALPDRHALQLARRVGEPCDVLVALARGGSSERIASAWDRLMQWRGLVRAEIARRRPAAVDAADTTAARARDRWLTAQRRLAQNAVSGLAHPLSPESRERFQSLLHEAEDAERRYVRESRAGTAAEDSVSLRRVRARLQSGDVLVSFARAQIGVGDATLCAFVMAASDSVPRLVSLGSAAAVERSVAAWAEALGTQPSADRARQRAAEAKCRRLGAEVRSLLWEPLANAAGAATRWHLVPEDAIWDLPWAALPIGRDRYVAELPLTIRVISAERELLVADEAPGATRLLVVGDPDFNHVDNASTSSGTTRARRRRWSCSPTAVPALERLTAARVEVDSIAALWSGQHGPRSVRQLLGAAADERSFKASAPGHHTIHLATHGIVVSDSCHRPTAPSGLRGVGGVVPVGGARRQNRSEDSSPAPRAETRSAERRAVWLALAGANRPSEEHADENEGLLTAEEVVTLDLRGTRWVVLSACHSGLAQRWAREGVSGMRRAFHVAGARGVIASQWPVADDATREWMTRLYSARGANPSASAAVHEACRATLAARRASGRSTHPFYWAAFGATGD